MPRLEQEGADCVIRVTTLLDSTFDCVPAESLQAEYGRIAGYLAKHGEPGSREDVSRRRVESIETCTDSLRCSRHIGASHARRFMHNACAPAGASTMARTYTIMGRKEPPELPAIEVSRYESRCPPFQAGDCASLEGPFISCSCQRDARPTM